MMKISRTVKHAPRLPPDIFFCELLDQSLWRREAQSRPPQCRVDSRELQRICLPGPIQIKVQRLQQSTVKFG